VAADDARVRSMQLAFADCAGPELFMSLVSMAEKSLSGLNTRVKANGANAESEFFFLQMAPQAVEFGNAMLWGGNTVVQAVIFDRFLAMKRSFES
jgi:hypothetical protein